MKIINKVIAIVVSICALLGMASAAQNNVVPSEAVVQIRMVQPYASHYLDSYGAGLSAKGNERMCVSYIVCGTRVMDKLGVDEILVEYWDGTEWAKELSVSGEDHDDFYSYNESDHTGTFYFYGMKGLKYRATITAYAELNGGSDTGTASSYTVVCM